MPATITDPDDIFYMDGRIGSTYPANGKYTLEELQAIVDGPIEVVALPLPYYKGTCLLIVNEEGLLRDGLTFNEAASQLAGTYIVGNALVLTNIKRMG